MKKRFVSMFLLMGLVFAANAYAGNGGKASLAPDRVGKWDLGLGIAAGMNDEFEDSAYYSSAISYGVTPYIGLGVEAGWQEGDGADANDETIGVVPILFDIILRVPTVHESLVPYGVLGLGVIGAYATNENAASALLEGDDSDDTGFGWKLGGGFDWFLNQNWILNFEFAYFSADVDLVTASPGNDEIDFWTVGGGLKYVF